MSDDKKPQLTRIPVRHLYFVDSLDIQGASQISNLRCYPEPAQQPNYWTADYLPAWNAFEIIWHRRDVPDDVRVMPVAHVRTWTK